MKEAEEMIGSIMTHGVEDYMELQRVAPEELKKHLYYFMFSTNTDLKSQRRQYITQDSILKPKQKKLYQAYEAIKKKSEKERTRLTIFRDYTATDTLTWLTHNVLSVWVEDYDTKLDKAIFRSSIVVSERTHPHLYTHIKKDCKLYEPIPVNIRS